jgi:predicted aspartyl protease
MMQLALKYDLPFVTVTVVYRGATLDMPHVLVDTGSASTVLAAHGVARVGLAPEPGDTLHTIGGVGGSEVVFTRRLDRLQVDRHGLDQFEIEVGGMDCGFTINGILGMDFLTSTGAILDLGGLTLEFRGGRGIGMT